MTKHTVYAASLGCIYDNVRSEPGSWIVVGMIPVYDLKKAVRAGRPTRGPESCAARKASLLHQCYNAVLQGWDSLTETVKRLQWADGTWRFTKFFLRGLLADQPETDTYCCDTSQSCKVCTCPKHKLHLLGPSSSLSSVSGYPLKVASKVQESVYKAADGEFCPNKQPLFDRTGPGPLWRPTCSQAAYERTRTVLNGTHVMPNAFWNRSGFDVQQMVKNTRIFYKYM